MRQPVTTDIAASTRVGAHPTGVLSRRRLGQLLGSGVALTLGGCQALPVAGPAVADIEGEAELRQRFPFELVRLEPDLIGVIESARETSEKFIGDLGPQDVRVGPGDSLAVTVVEVGGGGLYSAPSTPSNNDSGARVAAMPELTVDASGQIIVPFVGVLHVAGKTTIEIALEIQKALEGQSLQPQVTVNVVQSRSTRVTVGGSVRSPGSFPLFTGNERLLEIIARAGGNSESPADTVVQVTRFGNVHRVRLSQLVRNPEANIHVRSGDYVHLYAEARTYSVLGAADRINEMPLPATKLSLSEALARAGGPLDNFADSRSLFLFRHEEPDVMARLRPVIAKLGRRRGDDLQDEMGRRAARHAAGEPVPVIYSLNIMNGSGLFMARQFSVREKDLIYVPFAESVQWRKFLDLVRLSTTPVTDGMRNAKTGQTL